MKKDILFKNKVIGYISYTEDGQFFHIEDVQVFKSGTGSGTKAIKKIINMAKKKNKTVILTSDAMRGKDIQKKNRKLYLQLGFTKNSGKNKIKGIQEEFYLKP